MSDFSRGPSLASPGKAPPPLHRTRAMHTRTHVAESGFRATSVVEVEDLGEGLHGAVAVAAGVGERRHRGQLALARGEAQLGRELEELGHLVRVRVRVRVKGSG